MRAEDFWFVRLGDFAFLDFAVEIFRDRVPWPRVEEARLDVAQDHVVAGARENMRDAVAHGSRAEHGHGANCVEGHFSS